VVELVRSKLAEAGIHVTSEGRIGAERIDKEMLIDNHYGAIAAKVDLACVAHSREPAHIPCARLRLPCDHMPSLCAPSVCPRR
jgi:hypothetical protein